MIIDFFWSKLKDMDVDDMWFQQDGATFYTSPRWTFSKTDLRVWLSLAEVRELTPLDFSGVFWIGRSILVTAIDRCPYNQHNPPLIFTSEVLEQSSWYAVILLQVQTRLRSCNNNCFLSSLATYYFKGILHIFCHSIVPMLPWKVTLEPPGIEDHFNFVLVIFEGVISNDG